MGAATMRKSQLRDIAITSAIAATAGAIATALVTYMIERARTRLAEQETALRERELAVRQQELALAAAQQGLVGLGFR